MEPYIVLESSGLHAALQLNIAGVTSSIILIQMQRAYKKAPNQIKASSHFFRNKHVTDALLSLILPPCPAAHSAQLSLPYKKTCLIPDDHFP